MKPCLGFRLCQPSLLTKLTSGGLYSQVSWPSSLDFGQRGWQNQNTREGVPGEPWKWLVPRRGVWVSRPAQVIS